MIVFTRCKTENLIIDSISCSEKIILQYDKIKKGDKRKPIAKKELNTFTVYFVNTFNDSVKGYVNNELLYDKFIKTEDSSDNLKNYFGYNYSNDSKTPVLKIVSKNKNQCFDLEINKKYKLIYIFTTTDGKWIVRFSNIYYIN